MGLKCMELLQVNTVDEEGKWSKSGQMCGRFLYFV